MEGLRGQQLSDDSAMKLAISEAKKGAGHVSPNPTVGCVVLDKKNRLLAVGHHQKYGGAHAEVNAVLGLPDKQLQGARVFVTLEPCAHEGKTPSCAKMLAKLPLKEVIYGLVDPNPLVSGQGARILQEAGIRARHFGKWQNDLSESCEHFLVNMTERRPFVSLKAASSLDGQLAHISGESKWITGERARRFAHYLRATHDAVLVGKNTVLKDNPHLNIRHPKFPNKKNKVVILDSNGEILRRPELNVFLSHDPENIVLVTSNVSSGTDLCTVAQLDQNKDNAAFLNVLLIKLWDLQIRSVLVEGGAETLSSFINNRSADRLYLFQAPVLIGSRTGKSWSEQVTIASMDQRIRLKNPKVRKVGTDLLVTGRF
jgi:diaminohydroxyphosphoribosylaminopyrimidine deaminase / 5-amino-6-(5-phosphoribosylamino)uracil reductase